MNQMSNQTHNLTPLEGTFEVEPTQVIVRDDLPRIRTDMGDLKHMLESFQKYGQLQPIVVNRDMELIAGGRRLAACLLGGIKAKVIFNDTVDPLDMREMELEENIQRKSLTPSEELLAIKEIHTLKIAKYGEVKTGPAIDKENPGWGAKDTAELLGKGRTTIVQDLQLASFIEKFPELKECKTKGEIVKASKGISKVLERMQALKEFESTKESLDMLCKVYQMDAVEHMKTMEDNSVDLLLTDPPYGIDIQGNMMTIGGRTGSGFSSAGFLYDDNAERALGLYNELAIQSARFCKNTAHAWVFVGPEWFWEIRGMFIEQGWNVHVKPIIWIKGITGQCNYPSYWPSSTYEMIMYARRPSAHLIVEGRPDHVSFTPINPANKLHQAEKPVDLLKELITRTSLPGHVLYDPFCGAGSSVEAGILMKLYSIACDISIESYSATLKRLNDAKEKGVING